MNKTTFDPTTVLRSPMAAAMLCVSLGLAAARAAASPAASSTTGAQRVSVTGMVYDSIARTPLVGAYVQLVAEDSTAQFGQTTTTDAVGRYTFAGVPPGRYRLGFFHPMLDSLGLEPLSRSISVGGEDPLRANLAIPSARRLRAAVCGTGVGGESPSLLFGYVRDARTQASVADARVIAEWDEITISRSAGMSRRTPRRVTTTSSHGWYAFCDVPSPGLIRLIATRLSDSTDVLELQTSETGLFRRELFVGAIRANGTLAADASVPVRGTVVSKRSGAPLPGALIRMGTLDVARANDRGEFTLLDAPLGTRMLEVRALGYYVSKHPVDVVQGVAPVRLELETFKSVLDTMKVIANYDRFSNLAGFRDRQRSGLGRFLTPQDIAKRQPTVTSDLFRNFPSLFLDSAGDVEQKILMRSDFGDRCEPTIFLNGQAMLAMDISTLDNFVRPKDIIGIEVYVQSQAPPQFQGAMSGCGSIVIWSR